MKIEMVEKRYGTEEEIKDPCCPVFAKWWGSLFQLYKGKIYLCIKECYAGDYFYEPEELITHCLFCGTKLELEVSDNS